MIEKPSQPVPGALKIKPVKPEPPTSGSRKDILNHAIEYGEYTQKLENQLNAWIELFGEKQDENQNKK